MCPCNSLSTLGQCCPCPLNQGTGTAKPYQNRDRDMSYGTAVPIQSQKWCRGHARKGKCQVKWSAVGGRGMHNRCQRLGIDQFKIITLDSQGNIITLGSVRLVLGSSKRFGCWSVVVGTKGQLRTAPNYSPQLKEKDSCSCSFLLNRGTGTVNSYENRDRDSGQLSCWDL